MIGNLSIALSKLPGLATVLQAACKRFGDKQRQRRLTFESTCGPGGPW